jgi:two-component system, NtrC family, response regulator HydG
MQPRLAVISANDSFSEVWSQLARFAGADLDIATSVGEVRSIQATCGVIIAAAGAEDCAIAMLRELRSAAVQQSSVVVGVETNYRLVSNLLREGACEYFAFPGDFALCRSWIVERVERLRDRQKAEEFTADERERFDFSRMIGNSAVLRSSLRKTAKVIPKGAAAILITGETGTGKELLARAIHYNSHRAGGPFVEINCTTLPEQLLEAELFGFEPGAFTDARIAKPGLFEVANGGTLFLDEIGDVSAALQAKLLRVLEEKRVRRLGSVRSMDVDLRVVAATHVDLPAAVRDGRFRQDLFYRLNVVPIHLPALRDRGDDVILLAEHFLARFSREYEIRQPAFTEEVRRALRTHSWPGNVRELRNAMERGVLLGDGNLFVEDLFPRQHSPPPPNGALPFPASLQEIEEAAARAMLDRCGGNKSEAAKALGISRKHLYALLRRGEAE